MHGGLIGTLQTEFSMGLHHRGNNLVATCGVSAAAQNCNATAFRMAAGPYSGVNRGDTS